MLMFLFAAAQVGGVAIANSPPPPGEFRVVPLPSPASGIIVASESPPPPITAAKGYSEPDRLRTETETRVLRVDRLQVSVHLGQELLWQGMLDVNGMMGARYSETVQQAVAPTCMDPARSASSGHELSVNLSKSGGAYKDQDEYRVSAGYTRSSIATACKGMANRSVRVDDQVTVLPGQQVDIHGDAGLMVRLRRP